MLKDLLIDIAGLKSEDLTTEILRIILDNDDYSEDQKRIYNYIFDNYNNKCTKEYGYTVKSQAIYADGKPDLIIYNNNEVFILENKFYAQFSKGNQLERYSNLLEKEYANYKTKKVFLLTIKPRCIYYETELSNRGKASYKFLYWEDILDLFVTVDILCDSLKEYIYFNFLNTVRISKEDLMIYDNIKMAKAIFNLKSLIEQTRIEIENMNYNTGRMSQSINYYGFYIYNEKITTWFGYGLSWWLKSSPITTPLFLQIRDLFSPNPDFTTAFISNLKDLGFYEFEQEGWLMPLSTELFIEKCTLANKIKSCMDQLTKLPG